MEKFKAHMGKYGILYILLAVVAGIIVGKYWNTWFPSADGTGERQIFGCVSRGGVNCCNPNKWQFNNDTQQYECIELSSN